MSRLPTSKTTDGLSVKAEVGIAHYLAWYLGPAGFTWRTSSRGGVAANSPTVVVTAGSQSNHPQLPPAAGIYLVEIDVVLHWPAAPGNNRPGLLDDTLASLECAMLDITSAQSFLNLPSSGVDSRPVDLFHLYDISPAGSSLTTDASRWIESRTFTLTLCAANLVAAAAAAVSNTGDLFLRTDGTSLFRRPDTTSRYLRP